jgi:hypothetical protein
LLCFVPTDEYGSGASLDVVALESYIMKTHASDFLSSAVEDPLSEGSKLVVDALLNYARLAAPKEQTRKLMLHSKGVTKQMAENGGLETDFDENYHISHLDLLTPSDLAFVLWQVMNSWPDWTNKQKNKNGTKWTYVSRWTSDKKERVTQEGLDMYEKIHKWCLVLNSLKGTDEYSDFRAFLNQKAMERGLLRDYGREGKRKSHNVKVADEEVAPVVYDCDEFMYSVAI